MASPSDPTHRRSGSWRERWYEIIFEADTPAGKLFDVALLLAILLSVLVVMLESVEKVSLEHGRALLQAEWFFTVLFTLEYLVRIACAPRPLRYIFSFYGIVDLLAVLPTYLTVFLPEAWLPDEGVQRLAVIRALRLLRAFRIFKLAHMLSEARALRQAIWASRAKVTVFLAFVVVAVVIVGAAMHLIEGPEGGFDSIPKGMYWAIVTMTTVGYGDISPKTPLGMALAAFVMVLGYSMIIVPTGIVTAEIAQSARRPVSTQVCPECMAEGHDIDSKFCRFCGGQL